MEALHPVRIGIERLACQLTKLSVVSFALAVIFVIRHRYRIGTTTTSHDIFFIPKLFEVHKFAKCILDRTRLSYMMYFVQAQHLHMRIHSVLIRVFNEADNATLCMSAAIFVWLCVKLQTWLFH